MTDMLLNPARLSAPPRAGGLPLMGSVPNLVRKQTDFLFDAWHTYGDIYTLDLGVTNVIVLNHPDYAQYVLRDNFRNYTKGGAMWDSIRQLVGDGLVTAEGDLWRRQRRMMQPQFHRQHLAGLTQLMVAAIEDRMADWDKFAERGEPLNVEKAFATITMKVIVSTMFGTGLEADFANEMTDALAYVLDYILTSMVTGKIPEWLPAPGRQKHRDAIAFLDKYIYGLIDERRANPNQSGDLLTMMLNLVDAETNEQMTNKQLRDEAMTVFAAGYETTAIAMTWATHLLTQHPTIADQLATEVDRVLAGRTPQFEDLMQLSYPQAVMKEAMRLYPPAYMLPRTAVEADVIGGHQIEAGQMIFVLPLTIHRHPDFWDEPDRFDPNRHTPENTKGRHPLAWLPFGAGQRQCIGLDFALMEGTLILAAMAQRYRVQAAATRDPQMAFTTTLRSKDGVWVQLEKRKSLSTSE